MAIVFETALQLRFNKLSKAVESQTLKTSRFKPLLEPLQNTLISIHPVFHEESWRLNNALDRPQKETLIFISYLKKGKNLVLQSSVINFRNMYQKLFYKQQLVHLNSELVRFFQMKSQVKTPKVYELALNIRSKNYSLPDFGKEMGQLKVLSITGHNDYPTKLHNLSSIGCFSGLKSIRLEHVSVSVSSIRSVFALKNLKELSFVMCEISDALMSTFTTDQSPHNMLTNLTSLEFDMCYDLKELPSELLCNLVRLENLSITNCHELDVLPKGLGGLSNLEVLNLHCCTKLQGLPGSIGSLRNVRSIDISDCLSISVLPEEIGELCGLRVLKMKGCGGLQELPISMSKLWQLEEVICDEEMSYLWMDFESDLPNLKINVVEDDRLESFMKIVQ
ncbi:hypothetical protein SSX86_019371 [Deinandra increscens subsp. villosa]|uniref:RPW8 domain-containing protein n=1 Tax=Deinandra increscens subsp. villosa TaxID=3103831 RepID=A0AAP0CSI0_9ASTR